MQDGAGAEVVLALGYLGAEDKGFFPPCDCARVLHCAPVEVDDRNLVILFKGISQAEYLLEVIKTLSGDLKDFVSIDMFGERLAAVDAHWNCLSANIILMDVAVWTGNEYDDVRRNDRRRKK